MTGAPQFRPVADHALLVEFGTEIGAEVHAAVLRLDRALTAQPCPGLREVIPGMVNLLVGFDPVATDHPAVTAHLRALLARPDAGAAQGRRHEVPVCYDPALAPDLPAVARQTGLSQEAVIAAHLAGRFEVFMYGFAPGYAYLAGLPEALRLDRKPAPVRGVAAGSVLIAGAQCLVSTLTMPTGWWVIGRSPAVILDPAPGAARPFLFDVGDAVVFRRIDAADYAAMAKAREGASAEVGQGA